MPEVSNMIRPYLSHDEDTRSDEKILKLFFEFRKLAKQMTKEELESFVPVGAYGIFWAILEYMHKNKMKITDIELIADDLRISEKFIKIIMNDFNLFRQEEDYYFSERLIRDIKTVAAKAQKKSEAANRRWILSYLKKTYTEIFGAEPKLNDDEINKYIDYTIKIKDLKDKLADVLFTVKNLKFGNNPKFKPTINWLLKENNLTSMLNGTWGELKSWAEHKKEQAAKKKAEEEKIKEEKLCQERQQQFEEQIASINSKSEAIKFVLNNNISEDFSIIMPWCKNLMKKFDITKAELKQAREN